jgi:hypothetical protein
MDLIKADSDILRRFFEIIIVFPALKLYKYGLLQALRALYIGAYATER